MDKDESVEVMDRDRSVVYNASDLQLRTASSDDFGSYVRHQKAVQRCHSRPSMTWGTKCSMICTS